jgi:hypothetical protein
MGLLAWLLGCGERRPDAHFTTADGRAVYRGLTIDGSDARTFTVLSEHYAKDARRVYYCDTFRKGQEYYLVKHPRVAVLADADAATFRYLDEGYARDTARVYFEGAPFAVADVGTFELLTYGFARDRRTGYYHRTPVAGSDGATFEVLDASYARDRHAVYHARVDPGSDANGGRPIVRARRVRGAQLASFAVLELGYATDAARVYHDGEPLTTEVASFRLLPYDYAATATRVFYAGKPVPGADAASFRVLDMPTDSADARDGRGAFQQGRRVGDVSAAAR